MASMPAEYMETIQVHSVWNVRQQQQAHGRHAKTRATIQ